MKTRKFKPQPSRFKSAFALANGALLLLLCCAVQAQMTRSRPQPSPRSDSGVNPDSQPARSNGKTEAQATHSRSSDSKDSGTDQKDYDHDARKGSQARSGSRSGKVDFGKLFPSMKHSGVPGALARNPLPDTVVFGGGIFDGPDFPKSPAGSKPKSEEDTPQTRTARSTETVAAYDRYHQSQEASAVSKPAQHSDCSSQILWPYGAFSPFWGYSVDEVLWWPGRFPGRSPDPTVFFPGPDVWIVLGWPNYGL